MDLASLAKWLLAPSGVAAGAAAWLFRRRRTPPGTAPSGSWIGRRLAAERALIRCQQERKDDQESFARQLAGRDRELAGRDGEIVYLTNHIARLIGEGEHVVQKAETASARISPPSAGGQTVLRKTSPAWRRPSRNSRARTRTSTIP